MGNNGWIKLHRKLLNKGYWDKSQYVHLWVHLLLSANHKPNEYMTNGRIILIREGQLLTGRKQLSLATGIPQSTIEDILKLFENEQQIRQQKTTKYRLITILNWKDHQDSDNKATTKQQQADTNKNDKKEKKNTLGEQSSREEVPETREVEEVGEVRGSRECMEAFARINPTLEGTRNKAEFAALKRMIAKYGLEFALQMIESLSATYAIPFTTAITKPTELERDWFKLKVQIKKQESAITQPKSRGRGVEI